MRTSRALASLAVVAAVAAVVGYAASARSADHQDAPGTMAAPTADINDVYAWTNGNAVDLVMTVYPAAPTPALFDDHVQYVLHTASGSTFGSASDTVDIIATFDTTQKISLWVGTTEFLTGDASLTAGLASADGKVKVFAGLRADPFFFNLDGFKNAAATVGAVAATAGTDGGLTFNDGGCPILSVADKNLLVGQLGSQVDGGPAVNHFGTLNTLTIVVEVDKSLVTKGGALMSVWAGTYATAPLGDAGGQ